jgi:hypothetical protein
MLLVFPTVAKLPQRKHRRAIGVDHWPTFANGRRVSGERADEYANSDNQVMLSGERAPDSTLPNTVS